MIPPEKTRTDLTVVLPTRNRPSHVGAQLRFFRDCGLGHPVIIADSSDAIHAQSVRTGCVGLGEYRQFDPSTAVSDKLVEVVRSIDTPFVVMAPDDDVTFPHAIDAALEYLRKNGDYVAAHGYVLRFNMQRNDVDIHSVFSFTPTIGENDPLQRHYHLMRRYQPFIWAVFRTEAFLASVEAARKVGGIVFQEITFMNTAVLAGKVARLPVIFSMRGMESSLTPAGESNPFFWFLRDADSFVRHYAAYREILAQHIRDKGIVIPIDSSLTQLLDMIHMTWLGRELDLGMVNHMARLFIGDLIPPISIGPEGPTWRELASDDIVHPSTLGTRRYVWRREVVQAEPRDEILISAEDMADIEDQLDHYHL